MTEDVLIDKPIKTVSEYLDRIRELRKYFDISDHEGLWFRGDKDKYPNPLCPKLYRHNEGQARPILELLEMESDFHDKFMESGSQLTQEKLYEELWGWNWYFLMQHHDAPTRLLDWSESALIALQFAIRDSERETISSNDTGDKSSTKKPTTPLIYVFDPHKMEKYLEMQSDLPKLKRLWKKYFKTHPELKLDKLTKDDWDEAYYPGSKTFRKSLPLPSSPLVMSFDRISRRVMAQRGQFTISGTDPNWFANELLRPDSKIKEILIDRGSVYNLRIELKDCGITNSLAFPDLNGLGQELDILFKDRLSK